MWSPDQQEVHALTELEPGSQVAQTKSFDIIERVGEGGMGKVFRAFDPVMDQYVALKVLKLDVPESERRRFRREAVVAANFSHPNLLRVLDRGQMPQHDIEWLTMEYLRGRDLGLVLDLGRTIRLPLLVDIFSQTLDALDYVHTRRIVHCDIKPDNIFITRDPYDRRIVIVKLIDFGVCRFMDEPPDKQIIGDPRYMAPEQTVVGARITPAADLYALGLAFFEALTGEHPMGEEPDVEVSAMLKWQNRHDPPSVSSKLPDLPLPLAVAVDRLVAKACDKDPKRRYPDAVAMKADLKALLALDA